MTTPVLIDKYGRLTSSLDGNMFHENKTFLQHIVCNKYAWRPKVKWSEMKHMICDNNLM